MTRLTQATRLTERRGGRTAKSEKLPISSFGMWVSLSRSSVQEMLAHLTNGSLTSFSNLWHHLFSYHLQTEGDKRCALVGPHLWASWIGDQLTGVVGPGGEYVQRMVDCFYEDDFYAFQWVSDNSYPLLQACHRKVCNWDREQHASNRLGQNIPSHTHL